MGEIERLAMTTIWPLYIRPLYGHDTGRFAMSFAIRLHSAQIEMREHAIADIELMNLSFPFHLPSGVQKNYDMA